MQVFLVGFMGAGKSSLGKKLASRLGIQYVDMDLSIEANEGISISEIFDKKGEAHFRSLELEWINNLSGEGGVYALGGGTPCQEGVMNILREKGVPVYVKVAPGIIVSRLMNAKTIRPLIEPFKDDKAKLQVFVESKLKERESFYLRSKIIFESSDIKADMMDLLADLISLSGS